MSRRKTGKENIRNLQRSKGSYYVTIPRPIISKLGWQERQKVVVKEYGKGKILVSDWKK